MAVRNFDLTEPQSPGLTAVESAPPRRQELRKKKQRFAIVGVICLTAPFVAVLVVLGVAH